MHKRIKEHDKDIRLARTQTSAVSEHANKFVHYPLWDEVKFIYLFIYLFIYFLLQENAGDNKLHTHKTYITITGKQKHKQNKTKQKGLRFI